MDNLMYAIAHAIMSLRGAADSLERIEANTVEEHADRALEALEILKALKIATIKRYASKP